MQIPSCDKITNFIVTVIGTGSNSLHNGLNGFLQLVEHQVVRNPNQRKSKKVSAYTC